MTDRNSTVADAPPIVWNLHGSSLLLAPRLPTGKYRVDIIDDSGDLTSIEGDDEQAARDAAEELVEKRVCDRLWHGRMRQPRCTCAEYGGQESCSVHGNLAVHGRA